MSVPDEVAIVALDEFAWAPLLDPPLTVLNDDSESIGVLAAQILTRIIDEQMKADLIIRKSCGC